MRLRKFLLQTAAALAACAIVFLAAEPVTVRAREYGYTYNYDYWGDVQEGPDLYSVCKVFTSSDLKLEQKLNNPQGLFAYKDLLYLCDSGNNRII